MNKDKPNLIKAFLKKAGVKQNHLAISLGISPQAVNQVVLGQRATPRIRKAIASSVQKPESELWPDEHLKKQEAGIMSQNLMSFAGVLRGEEKEGN